MSERAELERLAGATMVPATEEDLLDDISWDHLSPYSGAVGGLRGKLVALHRGCTAAVALRSPEGMLWAAVRYPDGSLYIGREETGPDGRRR